MVKVNLLPGARASGTGAGLALSRMAVLSILAIALVLATIPMTISLQVTKLREVNGAVQARLESVKGVIAAIPPAKAQYSESASKLEWYYGLTSVGLDVSAFLRELRCTTPADVWVTSLEFGADANMTVAGYAMDFEAISQFMSQLKLSPMCSAVEMISSKLGAVSGGEAVSFQLRYVLNRG